MTSTLRERPRLVPNAGYISRTKAMAQRGGGQGTAGANLIGSTTHRRSQSLLNLCQPIIFMFKVTGLIWRERGGGKLQFCSAYCILVQLSILAFIVVMCFGYDGSDLDGHTLVSQITLHTFYIQVFILSSNSIYKYHKDFYSFVHVWDNYKLEHGGLNFEKLKAKVMKTFVILNVLVLSIAIGINAIMIFFPTTSMKRITNLFVGEAEPPPYINVVYAVHFLFSMCIWLQPCLMICNMCRLLAAEFRIVAKEFKQAMKNEDNQYESKRKGIEDFRLRHLALCDICNRLDNIASFLVMVIYIMDLATIITLFFRIATANLYKTEDDDVFLSTIMSGLLGVIVIFVHISFITYVGSELVVAAKSPKDILLHIDTRTLSRQEVVSVQIFLHKVTHDHIGLTLWKMLKVDKTVFLTMVAMIVAYVAMLLKFAIALKKPTNVLGAAVPQPCTPCNITATLN